MEGRGCNYDVGLLEDSSSKKKNYIRDGVRAVMDF
jgi:hypothetical protein